MKVRKDYGSSGIALVELSIIIPVMMMIIFAGLEFGLVIKRYTELSIISREAVNIAYRDCSQEINPASCIDLSGAKSLELGEMMVPGIALSVSQYRFDPILNRVTRVGYYNSQPEIAEYSSRYSEATFTLPSHLLNADNPNVTISEVYLSFGQFAPYLASALRIPIGTLYETSIF